MAKEIRKTNMVGAEEVDRFIPRQATRGQKFIRFVTGKQMGNILLSLFRGVLLIGICYLIIFPILITVVNSFKTQADVYDPTVILVPKTLNTATYSVMWSRYGILNLYIRSFLIAGGLALLQMVSCTLVAYGLARFKFKGNGFVFIMCIFTLLIPVQMLTKAMLFRYKAFNPLYMLVFGEQLYRVPNIDLTNSWTAISLLSATATMYRNGLFVFLLRQYFVNQPKELEEAAYIDGAGTFRTFVQVMLPSALPMLITVFLFAFVWQYNDRFYIGYLVTQPKVMASEIGSFAYDYVTNVLDDGGNDALRSIYFSACTVLFVAPVILLYCFCQRFFTQSIERSGMVG